MGRGAWRSYALTALGTMAVFAFAYIWWLKQQEDSVRRYQTEQQLFAFSSELTGWAIRYDERYPATLVGAVNSLQDDQEFSRSLSRRCPLIVQNQDAWGRSLIYGTEDDGKRVRIRSVGKNGKDDYGAADDIQVDAVLPSQ